MIDSTYNVNYTLQFAICTKSMELFELYLNKKSNFLFAQVTFC